MKHTLKSTLRNHLFYPWLALAILCLVGFIIISQLSGAHASPAPNASDTDNPPAETRGISSGGGVILRTDNVPHIRQVAREQGVKVLNVSSLPGNEALVTIEGTVANSGVQTMQLRARDSILTQAAPNRTYKASALPDDPRYSDQWNLEKINAPEAWDINRDLELEDVTIAVIDSGVLFSQSWEDSPECPPGTPCLQPDFPDEKRWTNPNEELDGTDTSGNGFIDDLHGWDFMGGWQGSDETCPNHNDSDTYEHPDFPGYIDEDNDAQPYSCDDPNDPSQLNKDHYDGSCGFGEGACYVGHGTLVASVAAAATDNNELIAGIDWNGIDGWNARIMNLRALDGYGVGNSSTISAAVEYATAMEADVINLSLAVFSGGSCTVVDSTLENALSEAAAAGIVVVAAAGNSGGDVCYPARSEHTIAVGATDEDDKRANFPGWWASNQGEALDLVAPGASVSAANAPSKADNYGNYTDNAHGTSLATPHVAGTVSLIKSIKGGATFSEVRDIVNQSATKTAAMNEEVFTNEYGHGRLNTEAAVRLADEQIPVYRLYSRQANNHFYTRSAAERDRAVENHGYRYEHVEFYACQSSEIPVYRLYSSQANNHFYTRSAAERDNAVQNHGYRYEHIAFYACESSEIPIYRLYSRQANNHFYTRSAAERDRAVENHGYRYEHVEFYASS